MTFIMDIEESQFNTEVLAYDGTIIVDFYGDDCAVCTAVASWLDTLQADMTVPVRKLFLSGGDSVLAQQYTIRSIPTLIRFENGMEQARLVGQTNFSLQAVRDFVS